MDPCNNRAARPAAKSLLVVNRGEIAVRILSSARENDFDTFALVTDNDSAHGVFASHVIALESPADYMNIEILLKLIRQYQIHFVHPGYGFLSENTSFARRLEEETDAVFVGPQWQVLEKTGDKLSARQLAVSNGVSCLPAMPQSTGEVEHIKQFATKVGLPIMLKAVDGGGGRGIRLVTQMHDLPGLARRAIEESPSKRVFAEKAAIDGFRHIEIQIIGDGTGECMHLWERDCSIQRRFQKIVELAPCRYSDRGLIASITAAALKIARSIKYKSLGTFEFLANEETKEFFFLEVNPRLQVEHTITESICGLDVVMLQLQIAKGETLRSLRESDQTGLSSISQDPTCPPKSCSIQLRITSEDVQNNFALSVGKISSFAMPHGNGVRVDTALVSERTNIVSADFDSLLAKIIITAPSWKVACAKALRALDDTHIEGVKTNLDLLRGVIVSADFSRAMFDTSWLERNAKHLIACGIEMSKQSRHHESANQSSRHRELPAASPGSTVALRKGDAWSVKLSSPQASDQHHLKLVKVVRNELPSLLSAEIEYTTNDGAKPYFLELEATSTSSASLMNAHSHRRGDPSNPRHIIIPFSGKLVEISVDVQDLVAQNDVICVIQQMKMELEVRAHRGGRVAWVTEVEDGEDVSEGMLAVELEDDGDTRARL